MNDKKLQVALDFLELPRAMAVAKSAVAGGADFIEIGTPLLKSEGLDAVRQMRAQFPQAVIIADTKTMDAGKIEAEAAAKAGASVMTVIGAADEATIRECVAAGKKYNIKVAVDLLGVADPVGFAKTAESLGVDWLDVHCAIDQQMKGQAPLDLLKKVRQAAPTITIAVAGGITSLTAASCIEAGADIIIVGGAITKAKDVAGATADIKTAMATGKAIESENFNRATEANLREILQTVRTSNISDGSHRKPCLEGMRPIAPGQFCCGPATTVRTFAGDWAKPVLAIDEANPGDVLVIDAGNCSPAIWGELASESAVNKGIAGLVVYGAVRDTADIRKLGFPVWSTLVTSHAGDPFGAGQINGPIMIANQPICPGDWIVADDDGVMVLPKDKAIEMANRAANVLEAENRLRQEIKDQNSTLAKVANLQRWQKVDVTKIIG